MAWYDWHCDCRLAWESTVRGLGKRGARHNSRSDCPQPNMPSKVTAMTPMFYPRAFFHCMTRFNLKYSTHPDQGAKGAHTVRCVIGRPPPLLSAEAPQGLTRIGPASASAENLRAQSQKEVRWTP
eukprot:357826-Chlamydomonas_euryale.AAC.4